MSKGRCKVPDCSNLVCAPRGLCRKHYDIPEVRDSYPSRERERVKSFNYRPNRDGKCWNESCERKMNFHQSTTGVCNKCRQLLKHHGELHRLESLGIEGRLFAMQVILPDTDCYGWRGSLDVEGYARLSWKGAMSVKAHRLSLSMKLGRPLTDYEKACHSCDNPTCTNPDHLFAGTAKDNYEDMIAKGRGRWQKEVV